MLISQNPTGQNFTSVFPMAIVEKGEVRTEEKIRRATMRELSMIMKNKQTKDSETEVFRAFVENDKDMRTVDGKIRHDITLKRCGNYLLTCGDAVELQKAGIDCGKTAAKINYVVANADEFVDTTQARRNDAKRCYQSAKNNYNSTIKKIIDRFWAQVKEKNDEFTKVYVYIKTKGNEKSPKVTVDKVIFGRYQKNPVEVSGPSHLSPPENIAEVNSQKAIDDKSKKSSGPVQLDLFD